MKQKGPFIRQYYQRDSQAPADDVHSKFSAAFRQKFFDHLLTVLLWLSSNSRCPSLAVLYFRHYRKGNPVHWRPEVYLLSVGE